MRRFSTKIILVTFIITVGFYLKRKVTKLGKETDIEQSTTSAATLEWRNAGARLESTKSEIGLPAPKEHMNRTDILSAKDNRKMALIEDAPLAQEEILLNRHFKQLVNTWRNTAGKEAYTAMDFKNICNTHSDLLIFEQMKHMYSLAGQNISQRFDDQILKAMSEILEPRLYNSTNYQYDIQLAHDLHDVYMKISETFLGKSTYGGSGFRIQVQGVHSFMCHVRDNFNGIYDVCCPYVPPCSNISVTLMYLSYGAFLDIINIEPVVLILARIENCGGNNTDQRSFEQFETDMIHDARFKCNRDPKFLSKYGRWILHNGGLRWGLHSKCLTEAMKPPKLRKCFENLSYVASYGDSNLAYTMNYFEQLVRNNSANHPSGRHWKFDGGHFTFRWCPGLPYVTEHLHADHDPTSSIKTPSKAKLKDQQENAVVIIHHGAWDLERGPFSNYLYSIQSSLVPLLRKYRQNPSFGTTRFIWVGTPAFLHKPKYLNKSHHKRNDFRVAVANAFIESLTKDLGVDFMDQLTPTSIMSGRTSDLCGIHYICQRKSPRPRSSGHVGIVMADMLFNEMCRNY